MKVEKVMVNVSGSPKAFIEARMGARLYAVSLYIDDQDTGVQIVQIEQAGTVQSIVVTANGVKLYPNANPANVPCKAGIKAEQVDYFLTYEECLAFFDENYAEAYLIDKVEENEKRVKIAEWEHTFEEPDLIHRVSCDINKIALLGDGFYCDSAQLEDDVLVLYCSCDFCPYPIGSATSSVSSVYLQTVTAENGRKMLTDISLEAAVRAAGKHIAYTKAFF